MYQSRRKRGNNVSLLPHTDRDCVSRRTYLCAPDVSDDAQSVDTQHQTRWIADEWTTLAA